jgi:hypothetical protein
MVWITAVGWMRRIAVKETLSLQRAVAGAELREVGRCERDGRPAPRTAYRQHAYARSLDPTFWGSAETLPALLLVKLLRSPSRARKSSMVRAIDRLSGRSQAAVRPQNAAKQHVTMSEDEQRSGPGSGP